LVGQLVRQLARVSTFPRLRRLCRDIAVVLAVLPASAVLALAADVNDPGAVRNSASASLRITLTIPPQTQLIAGETGTDTLCLRRIPASFLQVRWVRTDLAESSDSRFLLDSLEGRANVQGCIDLGPRPNFNPTGQAAGKYLLISAE